MKISVIVAYANNMVIGNNNKIPWYYKEDLEYFKTITSTTRKENNKNAIIMGYNTWLSIGKKLKHRVNIVITTKTNMENDKDLFFVNSLGDAIDVCKNGYNKIIENIFIIGGESIYNYFFKSYFYTMLDKIYITKINKNIDGNKYFLNLDDKFYYTQISTSYDHPELEYRVLQYNRNYEHPDSIYIDNVKNIIEKNGLFAVRFEYDLSNSRFPINTVVYKQTNIGELINNLLKMLNEKDIIETPLKLDDCLYYFNVDINNNISCLIQQEDADIISDIPKNVFYGSLLLHFLSVITKRKRDKLIYTVVNCFIKERNLNEANEIIWSTPKSLPILEIDDRDQTKYTDFLISDIHFLGID